MSAAVFATLAAATTVVLLREPPRRPTVQVADSTPDRTGEAYLSPAADLTRPVYRYSVVPGGVYTVDEVKLAMVRDPVVAAHYAGMNLATLRVETLETARWAHVSYRVGNAVYWTAKQLLLEAGETILTDGERMVRARCGNSVSVVSMEPLLDEEPVADEFERLGDPVLLAALAPADPFVVPSEQFPIFIPDDPTDPSDPPGHVPPGVGPPADDPPGEPPPPGSPPLPVPEPSTLLLVGAGAAGGLWRRYRNRRARE